MGIKTLSRCAAVVSLYKHSWRASYTHLIDTSLRPEIALIDIIMGILSTLHPLMLRAGFCSVFSV